MKQTGSRLTLYFLTCLASFDVKFCSLFFRIKDEPPPEKSVGQSVTLRVVKQLFESLEVAFFEYSPGSRPFSQSFPVSLFATVFFYNVLVRNLNELWSHKAPKLFQFNEFDFLITSIANLRKYTNLRVRSAHFFSLSPISPNVPMPMPVFGQRNKTDVMK